MTYEEDTYSKIFNALKHPVRRKIIGILNEKPSTYTELLNRLEVETGFLNYHLDFLGELVKKDDGRYILSEFGRAAYELTKSVEAPVKKSGMTNPLDWKKSSTYISLILLVILIFSNIYLVYAYQSLSREKTNLINDSLLQSKIFLTKSINILNYTINECRIDLINLEELHDEVIKLSEKYKLLMYIDLQHREQWSQIKESADDFLIFIKDLNNKITAYFILESNMNYVNVELGQKLYLIKIKDDLLEIKRLIFPEEITTITMEGDIMKIIEISIILKTDILSARRAFNLGERGF